MFDRQIFGLPGAGKALAFCIASSILLALLTIGQALSLSFAIVAVWNGGALSDQLPMVAAFAACFVMRACVHALQDSYMERYAHGCASSLRQGVAGRLYDCGSAMPDKFGSAAIVTFLAEGCFKIEAYLRKTIPRTVGVVVIPACICVAVFVQDSISGIIVLVCYPFIIVFMRLIGYTASDESAKRHDGFVEMSGHFMDSLRGMETLRSFGVSRAYSSTVRAASERYRKMVMKTLRTAQLSGAVLDIFATCGLAAVAIMLGFRMVEGSIAFLPALVVLMLVPEYFMPIRSYASDYHASLDGRSALEKATGLLECDRRSVELPALGTGVGEGRSVAVVGASGSGKSSLLDAMAGACDATGGRLSVCGVSGDGLSSAEWRRRVAYIPQHPYVFTGTLRDNVTLYDPSASDAEVFDALAKAGLGQLAGSLPQGIDSMLGEGGRKLSGGEAHRVALARAIVGGRDVWLLDEPGSSLDEQTELELKRSILPLMEGRTVVIATHRMHWLDDVDEVLDVEGRKEVRNERV